MKILIIADSDPRKKPVGGIGTYAKSLAKYLVSKKVKVIFLGKKHDGRVIEKLDMEYIDANRKANAGNFSFLVSLLLNRPKIDERTVIHAQRPDWLLPFVFLKNRKIVTLHGSHARNVFLKKGWILGSLYSAIEKFCLKRADVVISVSEENTEFYRSKYPGIRIITIPIGINFSKPKEYDIGVKGPVITFIGRLEKEKNIEMLIDAVRGMDVTLLIVGSGREEKHLKKYAGENVRFLGMVRNEDIAGILAKTDVFGLTSLYEGLPTVILEAFAQGVPAVATKVGDVPKLVENGKTGYIVTKHNIKKAIEAILKEPGNFRKNCIEKAKEYGWEKIGKRIVETYD